MTFISSEIKQLYSLLSHSDNEHKQARALTPLPVRGSVSVSVVRCHSLAHGSLISSASLCSSHSQLKVFFGKPLLILSRKLKSIAPHSVGSKPIWRIGMHQTLCLHWREEALHPLSSSTAFDRARLRAWACLVHSLYLSSGVDCSPTRSWDPPVRLWLSATHDF